MAEFGLFFYKKGKLRSFSIDCLLKQRSVSDSLTSQIQFHGTRQHIWVAWSRQSNTTEVTMLFLFSLVWFCLSLNTHHMSSQTWMYHRLNLPPTRTEEVGTFNEPSLFQREHSSSVFSLICSRCWQCCWTDVGLSAIELGFKQGSACASVARPKGTPTP